MNGPPKGRCRQRNVAPSAAYIRKMCRAIGAERERSEWVDGKEVCEDFRHDIVWQGEDGVCVGVELPLVGAPLVL